MRNVLEGIGRGLVNDNDQFSGKTMPSAVSESRKVGGDGPEKSAGLTGAPMTTVPHVDKGGGPSFTPELRADLQKLPPAARKALTRR